jgi:hypothetical protein
VLALSAGLTATPAAATLPETGRCPTLTGGPDGPADDASATPQLRPGESVDLHDLLRLRELLPPEIWAHREVFFYEGMRLEIGPCFRVYPSPPWFEEATRTFSGKARLDEEGNLRDAVAGLPFPPESIDLAAPDAGARWAWNVELRYRGAGPVGSFRLLDLPSRLGTPETYLGSFFVVATGNRADLADSNYRLPEASKRMWVAGGRFDEPFNARHLSWRQLRPIDAMRDFEKPDDTFVYVPTMRKARRAATAWVDGLYAPRYAVSGDAGGGGVPFGSNQYGPAGSIQPTAGLSIAASEYMRRGFTGLAFRPNAYQWRVVGERPVLAPLNVVMAGWPENPDRNYGPSGLSVATDRWDVRQAVVIEGRARRIVEDVGYVRLWVDQQTAQPLYMVTERPNRLPLDVGILVHRYSGDLPNYPEWPGGGRAHVFDPVAALFYEAAGGGSGWRRESYDVLSVPVAAERVREMTSTDSLERRGH